MMTREKIKKLAKDPREEELILKGLQIAFDIAEEHERSYERAGMSEPAHTMWAFKSDLLDAFFRR